MAGQPANPGQRAKCPRLEPSGTSQLPPIRRTEPRNLRVPTCGGRRQTRLMCFTPRYDPCQSTTRTVARVGSAESGITMPAANALRK